LHSLLLLLFAVVGAAVAIGSTIVVSFAADCETIAAVNIVLIVLKMFVLLLLLLNESF
jgi:hypothetical protein